MSTEQKEKPAYGMKDYKAADPRWCTGCGDYTILVGMRKFFSNAQLPPHKLVNISGIGCSGRMPHYLETYGLHGVHGRAVPLAMGVALTRPDLKVFIHSGDGDSISIGGNHLLHGIHKNFNCVYLMYDNQIYGLTKNQSSPTTRQGLPTMSQPAGTYIEPINPVKFALGLGATFIATTAEWMNKHLVDTLEKAYAHQGFSFIHIAQRCPKFNPAAWDFQNNEWITFMEHENGIAADPRISKGAKIIQHDPSNKNGAFEAAEEVPNIFGLFYQEKKETYCNLVQKNTKNTAQKDPNKILDAFQL
ncbi:MAG: thiamine pyrophosphate-dependent enzyme [bacterium]